jgi:hypothetical protein
MGSWWAPSSDLPIPAPPALGPYAGVPWPDPLGTSAMDVVNAYQSMMNARSLPMGYYQGGDVGAGPAAASGAASYLAPASSGTTWGGSQSYITPARQAQLDRGMTGYGKMHRTMRVGNVKALHRAMRRLSGFERLARKVITFTHPHAGRKFKFHHKRKRT